jgi:hypothetical protein
MITFPEHFVATRFPGYYWNVETQKLYSIKVTGVLTELKRSKPCYFNRQFEGYQVSVKGFRRLLDMPYLRSLKPKDSVIPVKRDDRE